MEIVKTKLDGVLLIKPDIFKDSRGSFTEVYNKKLYAQNGIILDFVEDDYSISSKNVLRGLHGDRKTWKLVDCARGEIYLVVLDAIEGSPQYGEWEAFNISDSNHWHVLIPPQFGAGYLALTDEVAFHYKQSEYYDRQGQFSIRYDDPRFKIKWPVQNPILSERDGGAAE